MDASSGCVNRGFSLNGRKAYFCTSPTFEAPVGSPYEWLNDALFICKPAKAPEGYDIAFDIWKID